MEDRRTVWPELSFVQVEQHDGIVTLTLNRPTQSNAIDESLASDLWRASNALATAADFDALLIGGAGPRFSVGGDLRYLNTLDDAVRGTTILAMTEIFHDALKALHRLDAPIVLAARGAVAGGALGFLGVADIVLIAPNTVFAVGSRANGLPLDGGVSWVLPRLIGARRAAEMYFEERVVTAEEAVEWGLATRIVPDNELDESARQLIEHLVAPGRGQATWHVRHLMAESSGTDFASHLDRELDVMREVASGGFGSFNVRPTR